MDISESLYRKCEVFIDNRLQTLQNTIKDIQTSLLSETKSSAGDKHETGRAMLQLEREKVGTQLAEAQKVKEVLAKISLRIVSETICLGSVVYTTQANYFIAISAGQLQVDNINYFAISPKTPISQLLLSKREGDHITFRGQYIKIEKII